MKYDYFISARFRNRDAALDITKKLREKGKSVYCFLENPYASKNAKKDPEKFMKKFEAIKNWRKNKYVNATFRDDITGLKKSKALIMLLPAGKSCHMEAGIAYALNKKCILIGEVKETESLYLIFSEVYSTAEAFVKSVSS